MMVSCVSIIVNCSIRKTVVSEILTTNRGKISLACGMGSSHTVRNCATHVIYLGVFVYAHIP